MSKRARDLKWLNRRRRQYEAAGKLDEYHAIVASAVVIVVVQAADEIWGRETVIKWLRNFFNTDSWCNREVQGAD